MHKILFLSALSAVLLLSCSDHHSESLTNKFANPEIRKIAQLCDERKSLDLIPYFNNSDAALRLEAVKSFASIRDTAYVSEIVTRLSDTDNAVRAAAAYALGQTASVVALADLIRACDTEKDAAVNQDIYEAIGKLAGKCYSEGEAEDLLEQAITLLDTCRFDTEEERIGWAKGAFWLHLSKCTDNRLMNRMPFVLQVTGGSSRVACAQAMSRFSDDNWYHNEKNGKYVLEWCRTERNPDVRIWQMNMLSRLKNPEAATLLKGYLNSESQDQTVKIAALRAASKIQAITADDVMPLLNSPDDYVALECLNTLAKKEFKLKGEEILNICRNRSAIIYANALQLLNSEKSVSYNDEIKSAYDQAKSEYDRVHFAHAMASASVFAPDLIKLITSEKIYAVKYALTESIVSIWQSGKWPAEINFYETAKLLFVNGDIGVQALLASALRENTIPEPLRQDLHDVLSDALNRLVLPREIETWNEIIRTINHIGVVKMEEAKASFNHPIDWNQVAEIHTSQKVTITTNKGKFILELHINDAPGSVVSFIQLVRDGFYNNKYFHRVIPNFVVQGGCPRGDGMGGTDYTLRSEFSLHSYDQGAVGLASSGPDTESCQWFVTHISTPHLEGRYTIFAHVSEGMDVVKKINVGDRIESIELLETD